MQEELPCLVEGCGWTGQFLSRHANMVHGITAEQLKELAGFNKRTGLATPAIREAMSQKALAEIAAGKMAMGNAKYLTHKGTHRPQRLEGKEHWKKATVDAMSTAPPKPPRPCRVCGKDVPQAFHGATYYCSSQCRTKYYSEQGKKEMRCSYCNALFLAKKYQQSGAAKGRPVCCSHTCRNQMNIATCLATRGRTLPRKEHHE
jgi:hypothetical protein